MIKVLVLVVSVCSLFACEKPRAQATDDNLKLIFDETKLSIPMKYILSGFSSSIVPVEGLDVSRGGVSISLPIEALGVAAKGNGGLSDKIIVLISGINDQINRNALNAWNGTDLYTNRIIEFDDQVGLYRVYPKAGFPVFWNYFIVSPLDGNDYLSSWVSSCTSPPKTDGKNLSKVKCKVVSRYKTVESQITISGEYIELHNSIVERYHSLLSSWEADSG